MTSRKHQALGKGLGALFPAELKVQEAPKEDSLQDCDTDVGENAGMESRQEGAAKQRGKESSLHKVQEDGEDALIPKPLVAFPCGSESMSSTRLPSMARPALKFTDVVVFPTPPF